MIHVSVTANELAHDLDDLDAMASVIDGSLPFGERCEVDSKMLIIHPIRITLAIFKGREYGYNMPQVKDAPSASRGLEGIFEDEPEVKVKDHYCAVWNEDLGRDGGWDRAGIKTVSVEDSLVTCYSTKMGTFGIVAELEDDPWAYDDPDWLFLFKMIAYALSVVLLLVFIGVIIYSTYLWEMFHMLGLHLATAFLMGKFNYCD